ncbi:MAG TPA: DUF1178 family protein [Allosphingosinicella sp.]
MIVFDIKCLGGGHVFEAWFGSTADYESQLARGLIQCPLCGADAVEKAAMAPRLGLKGNQQDDRSVVAAPPDSASVKATMAAMAQMQKKLLENSSYVGGRFADEARAIHLGEADARPIHGKATRAETVSLIEEGIAVAPLPFPVVEPGKEN